ncbi:MULTISPECIES: Uma2 family endonuclease [unclassified Microcoleus]|jgi:Uma2 family endonuclease|uniref:Uma2 family endonuclease n=1 Tax=unclassified Microcoleus TaxID=2642155 RepID=UPI001D7DC0FF|nr:MULTISPECIES: Uma2 family endonuclease [unclassified Microcoleus]MCC3472108.1 Uma2 family endonuclease [Microcoleus sp. PH2017_13_LAR_U_A]MCC3484655.1 Uma2 family endonuclease [Microcoleus sp. PH2017_14_LAR_D_A]MCC3595610.1 Uma2 family endonuclease [Microcoleus sp. PH2017_26_ELK_O_A]MCC3622157.1 Uma2 family endonuclease [Microcoleus sp. PH2017_36_ELK_O_B]
MLAETEKRYYTPEEYLALDEAAEYKSEYLDGEILPMTGGTANHNKIALNFCRIFPLTVSGQNYEIFINDMRLWIPRYRLYTYPDVMVIQGEPVYQGTNTTTVTNPLLIVEVLSKSTKDYDRGEKFLYYRSIPELREYILIDQYKYHVEQLTKTANDKWLFTEYESEDSVLAMDSVEFQISLTDIYDRINFEVAAE